MQKLLLGASFLFHMLAAGILLAQNAAPSSSTKPNIVLIVGDDMGYADVGFHGCKDIPTPHLDKLAAVGTRFTNGYVTGPYCSPTRAGLLTGRYQQRFGHEFNPGVATGLPTTEKTIADHLKAAGYKTALVGKWHLGDRPEYHPHLRGFETFYGFLGGAHDYFDDKGILRGNEPVQEKEYLTDAFAREAEVYIEKQKANPFFLYLAFNAVHTPMQADDPRLQKFAHIEDKQRRTYAAMMSAMDDAIGRVIAKLKATGTDKNTLVMFISDNGGPTMPGVTVNGSINKPLRGSKRTTLEGGIRVPFVVHWPGKFESSTYEHPVIQLDLHATMLAAAGAKPPVEFKADGVDLYTYVSNATNKPPHDALYWRFGSQSAIRMGAYKLVRYDTTADLDPNLPKTTSKAKLYNLKDDIGETKDLAAEMPEKVRELQAKWDAWNAELAKPLWGGNPAAKGQGKKKNAPKNE
ncbi:Arylsulfatase precursor [Anatilimnocola aggregata]|uniref:Arylsulfatase n=1 Tax=Anatilimnocola aggregata TaxID=2528021 RepID=A0A517YIM6_9BACT|nr:sulfatase [Anatilimnocola aggregata]QDU30065.1 Arylsulfatase precursor [Anatilimnocola aggregata]